MRELILKERVIHQGRDFRGRDAWIGIGPNPKRNGWVWVVGGHEVPITPEIMESRPRRVVLAYKGNELYEFEHIGILRAAGLQHVRLWSPAGISRPPYDGCSFNLWHDVMQHVRGGGELKAYRVPCRPIYSALPTETARCVSYAGDGNDREVLRMTGVIRYPGIYEDNYRFGFVYGPGCDLRPLMRARTLGWPPHRWYFSKLASKLGWPHHKNILWPQDGIPCAVLEETGRHRLLDMLSIYNFLAPAGTYLAGSLHSCMGGHSTDVPNIKKLYSIKATELEQAA